MKCPSCGVRLTLTTESAPTTTDFALTPPTNGGRPDSDKAWSRAFHEHFWPAYPYKIAKKDAERAWRQARPARRDDYQRRFSAILQVLGARKKKDWAGRESNKLPYPATFLRGEEF